ncbi:MAG: hypothetical protein OQJ95_02955 [Kangiella sp.]|jgi:hypothetical protein|nr:hypothetical protein [Kangiella sp.]MCW9027537.1 hypothetical protein [Kangiella sp.]
MKASGWLVLKGLLIIGISVGCQQHNEKPRLDTSSQQSFKSSLQKVRSQVSNDSIEQFDQLIHHTQHRFHLQKQYSLLPVSNPLNGLNAEEVLKLTSKSKEHSPRRLRNWTSF